MLMPTTVTWVIVANGERCRAFEERRRGGELQELTFWERAQNEEDRRHAHHEKAVEKQRFGFGHAVVNERDFDQQAERRFLSRYANELTLARAKRRYERLILVAPPRALGMLRDELGRTTRGSVERTEACDCVDTTTAALRQRLRALREPR